MLVDVVVRPSGSRATGSDTPSSIGWRQGGAAANTAAWLATTGTGVRLVGRLGADLAGRALTAELAAAGVDVAFLAVDPAARTGTVVALVSGDERDMFTDRGASARLGPDDLRTGWLDGAAHLHISGYALLDEVTRPAGLAAIDAAVRAGVPISVDPASAAPLAGVGAEAFLGWLPAGTLLTPNADEASLLTGCSDPEPAVRALGQRFGEAVVTCGADGALWSDGQNLRVHRASDLPEAEVLAAADPVGAGDAFTAGFLSARISGADVADQLAGGTTVAALAVGRR